MNTTRPSGPPIDTILRIVVAVLLVAGGLIHLKLYNDGYKDFPNDNLGRSFLLNVAASIVAAVIVVVWRSPWALLPGLLVVDGTLLAFGMSRTSRGIFGFNEQGFHPSPEAVLALIVEIGAAVLILVLLARELGARQPAAPAS
jgi:hypothetical protein